LKINPKKILKNTLITLLSIILLLIILTFSLRIPAVQNFVKDRLITYLEGKINTKVSLDKVYIDFPNHLEIRKFYLEGQDIDTLLYVKNLDVGLDIWQLINSKADINSIDLEGVKANVVRDENGKFNFDYILDAFASNEEEQEKESKPFIISLDKIKVKDIQVSFNDKQSGNNLKVAFNELDTRVKTFDLQQNSYAIDDLYFDGLNLKLKQDLVKEVSKKVEEKVDSLSESQPMKIGLKGIKLTNFNVEYADENTQMFAKVLFKEFKTKINRLDLENNDFEIGNILLNGLNLDFQQKSYQKIEQESEVDVKNQNEKPFRIALNRIDLLNSKINYQDGNSKINAKVILEKLNTKINKVDLENAIYEIDEIKLKGSNILANLYLAENNSDSNVQENSNSKPINLKLNELELDDSKIVYNNTAIKPQVKGLDYNHLNFSRLNASIKDFQMLDNSFVGSIKKLETQEKSGLNVQKLQTDFLYSEQQAYLKNLVLKTPKTFIQDEVILTYQSVNELTQNPGNIFLNANFKKSKLAFSDILLLVPDLRKTTPFDKYPNAILAFNTKINGKINDLTIHHLEVSGLDDLKVSASGKIKNAMNPDHLYYDLKVKNFSTSSKTIYNFLPKNTIPNNIRIPAKLAVKGNAKGSTEVVNTQLNIVTSLGNANLDAIIDMRRKDVEKYKIVADLQNLDVGTIISNKDLGKITANLKADGVSFNPEKMNSSIDGFVKSVDYNNYHYQNIDLKAKVNHGNFEANLDSKDENANLNLLASGLYKTDLTNVKLNGSINKLDINKLGFYADPMIIKGNIAADFKDLNPDALNGYLTLNEFAISDTKEIFPIQEMKLNASSTADSNQLSFNSQIVDAELKGKYKLTQIFGALSQTINHYYQFQDKNQEEKIDSNQYFTFHAKVKDNDLIRKFVPDLTSFETITLDANYDADSQRIELTSQIPNLIYGENSIENGSLELANNNAELQYNLKVAGLKNNSFQLNKIGISGDIHDNLVNYNVSTKDEEDKTQFLIAGNVQSIDEITKISLNPDGLILNYSKWNVADANEIKLLKNGFVANDFKLSNNGSEISVQSESDSPESPLNVKIKDFKIETITELIKKDDLPAAGNINGNATIRDLNKEMMFDAAIDITDLQAFGNPVGNLSVKAQNESTSVINTTISLTGNNNDLKVDGNYNTEQSAFDLDLAINRLEMKTVQGFSMNAIENTEGYISGNLAVKGTVDSPSILGNVKFNQVGLAIAEIGSDFRNIDDKIDFTSRGIEFNRFKINDKEGNSLTIDGQVLTKNYQDFAFNLTANARNFKLVNSEKSNDALMYGVLAVNANLGIKGDLDLPIVDGQLKVTDQTKFTFVLPQTSPSLQERDGIVEFIDQDQIALQETLVAEQIDTNSKIKGLDVNVNIEVDKEAKISVIIDKANGDFVELQGQAELNGGMDPSGKTTLTGVYQVEKGAYEMSVSLMKRRFDIQKGSTITFNGEPTAATLDLTAIYKTEAAPIDLVEQQISGLSSSEMNMYKQRMPFNTLLKLNGELLKPEITFDITLDDDNPSVATSVLDNTKSKLDQLRNDEAEMNKQVFALLLLNRFVGENPFQSQSGLSAETIAKQSVSNILSQQLNNLAADLIKGVDIDFGLDSEEDYSTGSKNTRTDLNVAVSKRLLNDRLKVSIGSNFGLEGEARENENTTNIAGDITVDYSLSRDGRYMLRAYRKNEYQVALQGQIIETGVGFIITLDYDKFKEIFEKKKRNRELKKSTRTETK